MTECARETWKSCRASRGPAHACDVKAGAYFDHDGDGFAEQTGWVDADDGLLVWDRDGDGRISGGAELFGDQTFLQSGSKAANGFAALSEWDDNYDGRIDSQDTIWSALRIWQDQDEDGFSAPNEFRTLSDLGIAGISLEYAASSTVDQYGNQYRQAGSYSKTDGSSAIVTDVWFKVDRAYSIAEEQITIPSEIAALPNARGYGQVFDLHQAMARDTSGALRDLVASFVVEVSPQARRELLDQIVFRWAGVEGVDPSSRGSAIDARRLASLERFFGESFILSGSPYPTTQAASLLEESYSGVADIVYAQLMAQSQLHSLYDLVSYVLEPTSQQQIGNISDVAAELQRRYALDPAQGKVYFDEFVTTLHVFQSTASFNLEQLRIDEYFSWLLDSHGRSRLEGTGNDDVLTGSGTLDVIWGGDGKDTIIGGGGEDILYGGAGNDTLTAGYQGDTIFGGDGNDTITDTGGSNSIDAGTGDDVVTVGILPGGATSSSTYGTNSILAGDGNDTVTVGYNTKNTIDGGAGDDVLRAERRDSWSSGNYTNTFIGGTGNDRLEGGYGVNTYIFNRGDGQDVINDSGGSYSNTDTIRFGAGIAQLDMMLTRNGNNLLITNHDSTDTVTIENWYSGSVYQAEQINLDDGTRLLNTQVDQLIQAMATFCATHSGISWDQAITQYPDEVQAVLTTYWQPAV